VSLLAAEHIAVSFGGVKAVQDVSFSVDAGEVFSIVGPNGAGKTTIFNLISRIYPVDEGRLLFDGEDITHVPRHAVPERGIARTFQNTELFDQETVLKNLLIGCHVHRRTGLWSDLLFLPSVRRQELAFRAVAEEVIDLLDLQRYREQVIANLPYGVRKLVEVARALCLRPRLLLLDEPSSGLNPEETEDLAFVLEDINEAFGVTVIMVEHDMNLVSRASNRVMALANGALIAIGAPGDVQRHPEVVRAYLGD
jgi:branched-chain amino acid transport system ATP-binding protein